MDNAPLRQHDGDVPGRGLERLVDAVLHEDFEKGREARVVVAPSELVAARAWCVVRVWCGLGENERGQFMAV